MKPDLLNFFKHNMQRKISTGFVICAFDKGKKYPGTYSPNSLWICLQVVSMVVKQLQNGSVSLSSSVFENSFGYVFGPALICLSLEPSFRVWKEFLIRSGHLLSKWAKIHPKQFWKTEEMAWRKELCITGHQTGICWVKPRNCSKYFFHQI